MASFSGCPPEIQQSILEFLPPGHLFSSLLVNKQWNAMAEPLLYYRIEMKWTAWEVPPITLLLQKILDRPELSNHIRSLYFDGVGFNHNEPPPKISVAALQMEKASETIRRTKTPYVDIWIQELQSGSMDAIITLLLTQFSNLTSLHLRPNFLIDNQALGMMLRLALCSPSEYQLPRFQNLQYVNLDCWPDEYRPEEVKNTMDILPFFYLPKIRYLSTVIHNPAEFMWPAEAPAPTSLVSLNLRRWREVWLGDLIGVLKGVQKIEWEWLHRENIDPEICEPIIDLDKIGAAMCSVHETLKDLTITAESLAVNFIDPPLVIKGSLDDMTRLDKLERLQIPWIFIMGFSPSSGKHLGGAIPKSTKFLTLTDDLFYDDKSEWDQAEILFCSLKSELELEGRIEASSPLRHITLQLFPLRELSVDRKAELEHISIQAGIELTWTRF
ncbi:hypothetical protein EDB80DRAFT_607092 [Ilyonectria destructans]|nr:hypothetical protein EDB80DRAFT_607092 [Ilyonectria destructans]